MTSRRPQTGPMLFGDDWPGLFIRGDNAAVYVFALQHVLKNRSIHWAHAETLADLLQELERAKMHTQQEVQKMQPFDDCLLKE